MIGVGQPLGRKRNFDWIESDLDLDSESRQLDSSLSGDLEIVGVLTSSENRTRVEDVRDWCEEFSPTSSAELVGNKNKISELDQFLRHSLTHPAPSILHLTGPSGCGKSTALRVLARELEMDVVEWNVPTTVMSSVAEPTIDYPAQYPEGQFKSFKRFLIQHNYAPLTKVSSPAVGETAGYISSKFTTTKRQKPSASDSHAKKRLLIVRDIPNTFFLTPSLMREVLRLYRDRGRHLLAFVVPSSHESADPFQRLFPIAVLQEFGIASMAFNSVHAQGMTKLITRVMLRQSGQLDTAMLEEVLEASAGDLRFALNTLHFYLFSSKPTFSRALRKEKVTKPTKRTRKKLPNSSSEQTFPSARVSSKNHPLSSLHAIGKILHAKRQPWTPDMPPAPLPQHLAHHTREELQYQPDHVFDTSSLSSDLFLAYLHSNLPDYFLDISELSTACEYLSLSDILSPLSHRLFHSPSHYAPHVASVGVSHSLTQCAPSKFRVQGPMDKGFREKLSNSKSLLNEIAIGSSQLETDLTRLATDLLSFPQLIPQQNYPTRLHRVICSFLFIHKPVFSSIESQPIPSPQTRDSPQMSLGETDLSQEDQSLVVEDFDDKDRW